MSQKKSVLLLFGAVGAIGAIAFAALALPSGVWRPTPENDCPNGLVCANWVWDGGLSEPCCIDLSQVGSVVWGTCHLRHDHPTSS